ncbi:NAD(P)-binding protein [Auricularia subglabra TFB-10046 SS5]|uniref:NAD(P)-binding protein n=1 Tax=Auricularia subglabra (strain TFB-10046 / SS5) TaxID=717982 RepID=J0D2Q8_AURST|nr:NAD(P)-binding protein [Auricularia subglabra TFB-10046 SS5]
MSQTVLVTGASKGIGLAVAEILLRDGAQVVAVQRSVTAGLAALQQKYTDTLRVVQGSFTDEDIIRRAVAAFGGLDSAVFNGGVNEPFGALATLPPDGWQGMFETNVFGVVRALRIVLPELRGAAAGARVVLVSSDAANHGIPTMGAYAASKAALNSINRTLAAEEQSIVSVAVHPGVVRTDMYTAFTVEAKAFAPPELLQMAEASAVEPVEPGRVIAALALRAPKELSGKYIHWNGEEVAGL